MKKEDLDHLDRYMPEFSEICTKMARIGKDFEEGKGDHKAMEEIFVRFATHPIMKWVGNLPDEKFIELFNIVNEKINKDKAVPTAYWTVDGVRKTRLDPMEIIWGYFGETDSGSDAEY